MHTRTIKLAFVMLTLLATSSLLGACHTLSGAGQDISNTGRTIKNSADRNTP